MDQPDEEFKEKSAEELVNPAQYKQALRQARENWSQRLSAMQVDLDLALSDPETLPEALQSVRDNLGEQIATVARRINEIDRRLSLSEGAEQGMMGTKRPEGKPELKVVPPSSEGKGESAE